MIANFKKKQNRNPFKSFLLILGGILIFFIIVLLIIVDIRIYQKRDKLALQIKNLESKIRDIQSRNSYLRQDILKSNDEKYIEKVAREELDLQKQGEKAFSFVVPDKLQQRDEEQKRDVFQEWLGWLGNSWQRLRDKF